MALLLRAAFIAGVSAGYLFWGAFVAGCIALVDTRTNAKRFLARKLAQLLQRLGPTFLKVGQVLSTRRDILPASLCNELALLQDSVPPLAPEKARIALAEAYGSKLSEIFKQIDYAAVASGSIACVYRGELWDGSYLAIKLQRPGIVTAMGADLGLMISLGQALAKLPYLRTIRLRETLDQLCNAVYAQLNFFYESENLLQLQRSLSRVPRVVVPRLDKSLCRDRVIVMEFITGLEMRGANNYYIATRKRLAATVLASVYRLLFVNGLVHCDLHLGNLYFKETGQVVLLDAGFCIQMSDKMRRLFGEFFLNMSIGNGRRCADLVIESSETNNPKLELEEFRLGFAELVRRYSRLAAKDFSLIKFAGEMFQLQHKFGLLIATELVFPLLSLLVIEGTVRALDPDIDFQKAAEPIVTEGIFGARQYAY